jgi:hypothetical protein
MTQRRHAPEEVYVFSASAEGRIKHLLQAIENASPKKDVARSASSPMHNLAGAMLGPIPEAPIQNPARWHLFEAWSHGTQHSGCLVALACAEHDCQPVVARTLIIVDKRYEIARRMAQYSVACQGNILLGLAAVSHPNTTCLPE